MSKKKAIVAIARKLAELMYTLMKNKSNYEERKFVTPVPAMEKLASQALQKEAI